MRYPKDFFRPLAVGAPAAAAGDPVPAVADDPLLPAVERRRWSAKVPDIAPTVDVLLGQPRGRRAGRRTRKPPAPAWSRSAKNVDFGDTQLWTRVNCARLAVGPRRPDHRASPRSATSST